MILLPSSTSVVFTCMCQVTPAQLLPLIRPPSPIKRINMIEWTNGFHTCHKRKREISAIMVRTVSTGSRSAACTLTRESALSNR